MPGSTGIWLKKLRTSLVILRQVQDDNHRDTEDMEKRGVFNAPSQNLPGRQQIFQALPNAAHARFLHRPATFHF
jgi:hypothetical protein